MMDLLAMLPWWHIGETAPDHGRMATDRATIILGKPAPRRISHRMLVQMHQALVRGRYINTAVRHENRLCGCNTAVLNLARSNITRGLPRFC